MLDDLLNYAEAQGLGTIGVNLFASRTPQNPDNCMSISLSGGPAPDRYLPTANPTFQVLIRTKEYDQGAERMAAVRSVFHRKANIMMGSTYVYYTALTAEGGPIGNDTEGRELFSLNFQSQIR